MFPNIKSSKNPEDYLETTDLFSVLNGATVLLIEQTHPIVNCVRFCAVS